MPILGGVGKDTVVEGGKQMQAVIDKVDHETIPAAEAAVKHASEYAVGGLSGLVADVANRLHGAECPVDITIEASAKVRIYGKIGALKLSNPEGEAGVKPSVTVEG